MNSLVACIQILQRQLPAHRMLLFSSRILFLTRLFFPLRNTYLSMVARKAAKKVAAKAVAKSV